MRTPKLMLKALGAVAFTAMVSVGCTGLKQYEIDAPDDLADKIAEYAAEKAAKQSDDYTEIDLTATLVGAEDNSSAWWSEFSQYFTVPSGKKLYLEFENFGSGVNNWNNWNVAVANGKERDTDGYAEYFVMRSDAYGWGNADYKGNMIEFDYNGVGVDGVNWDEFREKMQGAYVTLSLDHARAGAAYLEVHSVATDGFTIVEKYNQPVSATEDINAFLVADGSHFNMKKAYLVPSEIAEIPDYPLTELQLSNTPVTVALGDEDYWGATVATAVFEDGYTAEIPMEDLYIKEPDMSTTGTKTVVVSYAKTKLGKPGDPIAAYYTFEVTDFASISVTKLPYTTTYYLAGEAMPFFTGGLEVTGVKSDGSTAVLDNAALIFGDVQPLPGPQDIEIEFAGIKTSCPVTVKPGIEAVGATDFSNGWWTTFMAQDKPVPAGESATVHMFVYSDNLENWHSPCTILRNSALAEYAVTRMDSYGWGAGYEGNPDLKVESDWDFNVFAANQNMSAVSITVTNNGNNTADVVYNVTYATGETHVQKYLGIIVDSSDLQMGIVTEESYLVILDKPAADAKLVGISATATVNVVGGAKFLVLSPEAIQVMADYSDGSSAVLSASDVEFGINDMVYEATPGTYADVATVKYTPAGGSEMTAGVTLVVKASDQEGQATQVGASDFSGGWYDPATGYLTISKDWTVAAGQSQSVSMTVGSDNAGNWHSPSVVLRKADGSEYVVVRQDNFGWGNSWDACVKTCNWNWDTFASNINGSKVFITVSNDGQGMASICYHVVDASTDVYYQYYNQIAVDSSDVQFAVATEAAYLIFD